MGKSNYVGVMLKMKKICIYKNKCIFVTSVGDDIELIRLNFVE